MQNIPDIRPEIFAMRVARRSFGNTARDKMPVGYFTGLAHWVARIACCGASLLILGAGSPLSSRAEEQRFVGLLQNSPFGMEPVVPAVEPTMEFRGYVMEEGTIIFSLVSPDATGRIRSAWVGLDEPFADYVVRSFDRDSDTVQVEHRGQTLALKLKLNRVQLLQAPECPVAVVEPAAVADEKTRLEAIAGEIRRRRALRQASAENHGSDQP